ncbi:MAG: class I SAM-dependent methyltransferase [Planctomycetota bacterium]
MIVENRTFETVTWEDDLRDRVNAELMTRLLWNSVPALQSTRWHITRVEPGFTETVLPLNPETTNQHGTHQAALISLSADYTGGMALTTLLRGVPLSGIHRCGPEESASLWLAGMDVKYIKPSTGHLIGRCRVPEDKAKKIVSRYFSGKRVLVALPIEFESNGETVAKAELKYFAQPTIQLMDSSKRSALFNQKIKASARMIAGIRADHKINWSSQEQDPRDRTWRVDCPHASIAAGPHGQMLAARLKKALPQLPDMVLSRTRHIDELIDSIDSLDQVVMVGAGLDMRPFHHAVRRPDLTFIELDLPEMLEERDRVIELLDSPVAVKRVSIGADFLKDDVAELLNSSSAFDPSRSSVFIYEGCSMYFGEWHNRKMVESLGSLMANPDSRLWVDLVNRSVVDGQTRIPEVSAFLERMDEMGESFIFGSDKPGEFIDSCGLKTTETISVRDYLRRARGECVDPVFDVYHFCVARKP